MVFRIIAALLLSSALTACGGGGGGEVFVSVPVAQQPLYSEFRVTPTRTGVQTVASDQRDAAIYSFAVAAVVDPSCSINKLVFRERNGQIARYVDTRRPMFFTVNGQLLRTSAGQVPTVRLLDEATIEVIFPTPWTPPPTSYEYSIVADVASSAPRLSGAQLGLVSFGDNCRGARDMNFAGGAIITVADRLDRVAPYVQSVSSSVQFGTVGSVVSVDAVFVCAPAPSTAMCNVRGLTVQASSLTPEIVIGGVVFPMRGAASNLYTFALGTVIAPGSTIPFTVRSIVPVGGAVGFHLLEMPANLVGDQFDVNVRRPNACGTFAQPSDCKG